MGQVDGHGREDRRCIPGLSIGLVQAVYPAAEFAGRARDFALELATQPRQAVGVAKVAIDTAASVDRRTARDFDRFAQTTVFMGQEHKDRVAAFRERSVARQGNRSDGKGQNTSDA